MASVNVYLEIGQKKVFAGAVDWPGWCLWGPDEESALQALLEYGPRYAAVLQSAEIAFQVPEKMEALIVVERLQGNSTTDFGAPDVAVSIDSHPVDETELQRFAQLLNACWQAYESAAQSAAGVELCKGPRGGGREVDGITRHVLDSSAGYLSRIGSKLPKSTAPELMDELAHTRQAVTAALESAVSVGIPAQGPRGGARWTARYFVRRLAWHILDHVWEIENRRLDGDSA